MPRRFDAAKFVEEFQTLLTDRYRNWRYPPVILNLSRLACQACRQLGYAQWKNRDAINEAVRDWWAKLPKARDERFEHRLFDKDCRLAPSGGPTFVWVRRTSGVQAVDLVVFKSGA